MLVSYLNGYGVQQHSCAAIILMLHNPLQRIERIINWGTVPLSFVVAVPTHGPTHVPPF